MLQLGVGLAVFSYSLALGLAHTLQPCEDKAIFGFHAFGIAKNNLQAFSLILVYGLGIMTVNNLLGLAFSVMGNIFLFVPFLNDIITFVSPFVTIFLGCFFLYKLIKEGKADEHQAEPATFKVGRSMVGVYLLGIITGLPPCPFELHVYFLALSAKNVLIGIQYSFWFSVGTIIGLFFLALLSKSLTHLNILKKRKLLIQELIAIGLIVFGVISLILGIYDTFFVAI